MNRLSAVFFSLEFAVFFTCHLNAQKCQTSIGGIAVRDHVLSSFQIDSIHSCFERCKTELPCRSVNYFLVTSICELNNITITMKPSMQVVNLNAVYFQRPQPVPIGSHQEVPAESCAQIKYSTSSPTSGLYWIKHALYGVIEKIYCDMNVPGESSRMRRRLTAVLSAEQIIWKLK
ncbi:hypothetical protein QZH41_018772 [Actinostola sp. cb2023]|nr:hypothetical protein QZH41_018772 [Actinostola sp. cb2023]